MYQFYSKYIIDLISKSLFLSICILLINMIKYKFLFVSLYIYLIYLLSGLLLLTPITIINFYDKKYGFAIKNIYYISMGWIIKNILGTEIFVNSNELVQNLVKEKDQIIVTQNHFSEIDYMFLSYFITNLNSIANLINYKMIFVAKKFVGIAFLGVGLISLLSKDLYLNRDIQIDHNNLKYNNDANILYIFPEGTCFNSYTKKISDQYVKSNNLIKFNYLLYPRLTGMFTLLKTHKKYKNVYDLTVMFDSIPKDKLLIPHKFYHFFYQHDFPSRVFINIQKYKLATDLNFEPKIKEIFKNKDKFIQDFDLINNKFEKINYNQNLAITSFIISNITMGISLYLYYNYNFIKTLYFFQAVFYLITFYFLN